MQYQAVLPFCPLAALPVVFQTIEFSKEKPNWFILLKSRQVEVNKIILLIFFFF